MKLIFYILSVFLVILWMPGCEQDNDTPDNPEKPNVVAKKPQVPPLELDNPLKPIPKSPLGVQDELSDLENPPTPERVRLGRWLFYDKRLSADGNISCATCHIPEHAFSQLTPVATGIHEQKGARKSPSFINSAFALNPHFFWDGRAESLEDQASGPMQNPIEMGNTIEKVVEKINAIEGYKKYFQEAYGDKTITIDRVTQAIADYERTRLSGNSAWDRWKDGDENAVSEAVKKGDELFHGKALCNQCHLGDNFSEPIPQFRYRLEFKEQDFC